MKAVRVHEFGGPEVLRYEDVPVPEPGPGEVRIRIEASGVNFVDTYQRTGAYKGELPFTLGMEGAGAVDAVGEGVTSVQPGDLVAYAMTRGSYAEYAVVPEHVLARVPASSNARQAAAVILQGMTAHFLATSTFPLREGHVALIHAAAGGVGGLLVQIAKRCGATVLATCSTEEKAARRAPAGGRCRHPLHRGRLRDRGEAPDRRCRRARRLRWCRTGHLHGRGSIACAAWHDGALWRSQRRRPPPSTRRCNAQGFALPDAHAVGGRLRGHARRAATAPRTSSRGYAERARRAGGPRLPALRGRRGAPDHRGTQDTGQAAARP